MGQYNSAEQRTEGLQMTDKHTNANDAGRRVGEPRLVQVGETPMVLPRCWLARWTS